METDVETPVQAGTLIDFYKRLQTCINPTFITHHPGSFWPVKMMKTPWCGLSVGGQCWEVVNAYSELVDPVDQARHFKHALPGLGDKEAMDVDNDFLQCIEFRCLHFGWGMGLTGSLPIKCSHLA